MTDDPLRERIARTDPAADHATEPITGASARALLEDIMNTPLLDSEPTQQNAPPHKRKAWAWPTLVAAAAVVALGLGAIAASGAFGDDTDTDDIAGAPATTDAPPTGKLKVLELSAGTDDVMAMCMQISPELIADTQVAFKGTVQTSENGIVTLTIDQPYKGTDAQMATLVAPEGTEALIGGVSFEPGQQYLITATDGVVNYCGFSGPATPELQALFDQAFPAG
jgi:hypothetical protein